MRIRIRSAQGKHPQLARAVRASLVLCCLWLVGLFPSYSFGQSQLVNGDLVIVGSENYCATSSASGTAYACSLSQAITIYSTGAKYLFKADVANTGSATLQLNGIATPRTLQKMQGGALVNLVAGDIAANDFVLVTYTGTVMKLLSASANTPALPLARASGGTGDTKLIRGIVLEVGSPTATAALTTADVAYVTIPVACTISAYALSVDAADATVRVKFWKVADGTANPASGNSINTSGLGVPSGTHVKSTTLTDFTSTAVSAFDVLALNVSVANTAKYISALLQCDQT